MDRPGSSVRSSYSSTTRRAWAIAGVAKRSDKNVRMPTERLRREHFMNPWLELRGIPKSSAFLGTGGRNLVRSNRRGVPAGAAPHSGGKHASDSAMAHGVLSRRRFGAGSDLGTAGLRHPGIRHIGGLGPK